jgi:hypothetical protein
LSGKVLLTLGEWRPRLVQHPTIARAAPTQTMLQPQMVVVLRWRWGPRLHTVKCVTLMP